MESKLSKDLLNILIDPARCRSSCFLCFKQNKETYSIYEVFEICDQYFQISVSVYSMMRYLFPSYDTALEHACNECMNLIFKMYILIENYNLKQKYLYNILESLEYDISQKSECLIQNLEAGKIRIHIQKYNNIEDNQNKKLNAEKFEDEPKTQTINEVSNKNLLLESFLCKKCLAQFGSKDFLRNHSKNCKKSQTSALICDTCGMVCKSPQTLKAHLNSHQQKQCPYCTKSLKTHSHFKLHVKNHEQQQKRRRKRLFYNCNDCYYRSENKESLEAHINKIHLHIRPYICQICSKGFYRKSNLTEHVHIHSKVKSHICETCGESFSTKKCLVEHLRLHSKEKPYECAVCSKKFVTSGRRSDHNKRQHMMKNEICFLCNKKYSLRKDLNRHIKKVHGSNSMTPTVIQNTSQYNYVYSNVDFNTENSNQLL